MDRKLSPRTVTQEPEVLWEALLNFIANFEDHAAKEDDLFHALFQKRR